MSRTEISATASTVIARFDTISIDNCVELKGESWARFKVSSPRQNPKFHHIEMLVPTEEIIQATRDGKSRLAVCIPAGDSTSIVELPNGELQRYADRPSVTRKNTLYGHILVDVFTKHFRGYHVDILPKYIVVLIHKASTTEAKSPYYGLLSH